MGSIGYTLPATLGTQMANPNRRNILLIGDGSLQLYSSRAIYDDSPRYQTDYLRD